MLLGVIFCFLNKIAFTYQKKKKEKKKDYNHTIHNPFTNLMSNKCNLCWISLEDTYDPTFLFLPYVGQPEDDCL